MTANVTIDVATVRDVLRIPNAALRFKPETDGRAAGDGGGRSGGSTVRLRRRPRSADAVPAAPAAADGQAGGRGGAVGAGARRQRPPATGRPSTSSTRDKKLKPVEIRTGITDGHYTQVRSPAS